MKKENKIKVGAHVSIAGGVFNAPKNAKDLDCETFQIFTRSPQGGPAPKLTDEVLAMFYSNMKEYGFGDLVIHSPYYVNFGSVEPRIYNGSSSVIRSDLERGSLLSADYVIFHVGSFGKSGIGYDEGMARVISGLEKTLEGYEGKTKLCLENSAGAGRVIGSTFEELYMIMERLSKYSGFGGVCFDTQHAFGSGYDLRDETAVKETFDKYDKILGLDTLKVMQVNDSKVPLASKKDRHDHIADGLIGESGFEEILAYLKKKNIHVNLILETKHDEVQSDIKILKKLRDKIYGI